MFYMFIIYMCIRVGYRLAQVCIFCIALSLVSGAPLIRLSSWSYPAVSVRKDNDFFRKCMFYKKIYQANSKKSVLQPHISNTFPPPKVLMTRRHIHDNCNINLKRCMQTHYLNLIRQQQIYIEKQNIAGQNSKTTIT